jgi:hypothetical protein
MFGYTVLGFGAGILDSFTPFIAKFKPDGSSSTDNSNYPINVAFDDNTKGVFVCVWRNSTDSNVKAVVGTHSAGSIVFGTPVVVSSDSSADVPRMDFDKSTAGKFVVQYNTGSRHGAGSPTFQVGTISNTGVNATISMGSASVMPNGPAYPNSTWHATVGDMAIGADGQYVYFAGYDQSSSNEGRISRWTLDSTSVSSWNYIGQFHANGRAHVMESALDTNDSVILLYTQNGANLMARKVSPNNTGSDQQVTSNGVECHGMTPNPNTTSDVLFYYRDEANSDYPTARIGRWSGYNCSFGTAVVLESAAADSQIAGHFDFGTAKDQAVVMWAINNSPRAARLEIDGTTVTLAESKGSATINGGIDVHDMGSSGYNGLDFDQHDLGKYIFAMKHAPGSGETDNGVPFVATGSIPSA